MKRCAMLLCLLSIFVLQAELSATSAPDTQAQSSTIAPRLVNLKFLMGKWTGFANATAGKGPGGLEFVSDLDGKLLKAISTQEFPATDKHPAFTYRSIMYISSPTTALFVDNEGHVLHHTVQVLSKPLRVVFTSKPEPYSPRFRLTYVDLGGGKAKCIFEIAPYGSKTYTQHVEGTGERQK
jgi:hypothetical protein